MQFLYQLQKIGYKFIPAWRDTIWTSSQVCVAVTNNGGEKERGGGQLRDNPSKSPEKSLEF